MKVLIVTAYFLIGALFMGTLPDSSGKPFFGTLVFLADIHSCSDSIQDI